MGKKKLQRFEEMKDFEHVFQPSFKEIWKKDYSLKNYWGKNYFGNNNPIILELGCGKGEYTIGLAEKYPHKNFIGVDIKGSRMYVGAKAALQKKLANVGFIRTQVEFIDSFFGMNEIDEIWITFPDPQMKIIRSKKRLTSSRFLNIYKQFIKQDGLVHLKTDNDILYEYTNALVCENNLKIIHNISDIHTQEKPNEILSIKTFYEKQFLAQGKNIYYISFILPQDHLIHEPADKYGISGEKAP